MFYNAALSTFSWLSTFTGLENIVCLKLKYGLPWK